MSKKYDWFRLVISEKKITHAQFRVLMCIWNHMDSELKAYPSREKIREITGCEFNTITNATKNASDLGYLILSYRRHNNSQHRHRVYRGIIP